MCRFPVVGFVPWLPEFFLKKNQSPWVPEEVW